MDGLVDYGLFLAKIITVVLSLLFLMAGLISIANKNKESEKLIIKKLNDKYHELQDALQAMILPKADYKAIRKASRLAVKAAKKAPARKRIFILSFIGDISASAVAHLRKEVDALLTIANDSDEIFVRLESPGGMVHGYGLVASQLQRIKQRQIPLIVSIDKVAASGGYLIAAVADRILAAPFAIIGSIGVLAQLPNFNRFLKHHHIDFEQIAAGEYKRTLSLFGENTEKGRQKMQAEIDEIHALFKSHITQYRNKLDIDKVATGEYWLASKALDLKLVDELITSDDYLLQASQHADLYEISYKIKKPLSERILQRAQSIWFEICKLTMTQSKIDSSVL